MNKKQKEQLKEQLDRIKEIITTNEYNSVEAKMGAIRACTDIAEKNIYGVPNEADN